MKNKNYPTDKQINYILNLASTIDMYIELIGKPQQKPKDFALRDVSLKEKFHEEITTNQDVQKLIQTLMNVYMKTELLYRSSRDRGITTFKHILTVEKFKSDSLGRIKKFKDDYIMLCRYFDLIEYDTLEAMILTNLREE